MDDEPTVPDGSVSLVCGGTKLSAAACVALSQAIDTIKAEHKLSNGSTALYFHLVAIVESHLAGAQK